MKAALKLILLLAFSSSILLIPDLNFLRISFIALSMMVIIYNLQSRFVEWLKPMILIFSIIIIVQFATFPAAPFTAEAFIWGLVFSMRLFTLVTAVFMFVHTTPMSRIADAFSFLPGSIPQVFTLAIGMLPNITELSGKIMNSQKARGVNFRSPNVTKTYMPVMVPLFGKTLYKSEKMALAMQARGYGD